MASEASITDSFGSLIDYFTPAKKRATLGQPHQSRKQIRSQLKRRLYSSLFTYLKNKERYASVN
jgi:hypothetical protein